MKYAPKYCGCNVLLCSVTRSSGKPAASRCQANSSKARVPLGNTGRGFIAYVTSINACVIRRLGPSRHYRQLAPGFFPSNMT